MKLHDARNWRTINVAKANQELKKTAKAVFMLLLAIYAVNVILNIAGLLI